LKIAYLVFAYKNPKLLGRVVDWLSCEGCSFFIHIDAKSDLDDFSAIRGQNVFFTSRRIPVYWAEFSGVEAILLLIREALASPRRHDYFVLLSGSEFPLRSREYIHRFFEAHPGSEYITMVRVPGPGKPLSRLTTLRFPSTRPFLRLLFRALAKIGLARRNYRKHLGCLDLYSGNTWWALSREACEYISEFAKHDQKLAKFLKNAHAPEETFIHTVLGNSPFKSRVRRNLMYEDWDVPGVRHGPRLLSAEHLEFFASRDEICVEDIHGPGELLFARKFSDDDLSLIDRVEEMIRNKQSSGPDRKIRERRTELEY
jgi:Core-2/I-Branching enzyme